MFLVVMKVKFKMKREEELIWESYQDKGEKQFKTAYHVTYKDNIESIKKHGLIPSKLEDFEESVEGVDNCTTKL
jgi:hypothetical protein